MSRAWCEARYRDSDADEDFDLIEVHLDAILQARNLTLLNWPNWSTTPWRTCRCSRTAGHVRCGSPPWQPSAENSTANRASYSCTQATAKTIGDSMPAELC